MYTKKQIPTPFLQNQTPSEKQTIPSIESHTPSKRTQTHMQTHMQTQTQTHIQKNTYPAHSAALAVLLLLCQGER